MIPIIISASASAACTSSGVSWVDASNQVGNLYVGDSISNAYTFTLPIPTITNDLCRIVAHSVTVLTKSPTSLSYGI